jgi:hypothetical protein
MSIGTTTTIIILIIIIIITTTTRICPDNENISFTPQPIPHSKAMPKSPVWKKTWSFNLANSTRH